MNKLEQKQKSHESFTQQLITRSDDVKKLLDFYNQQDKNISNEIESNWNNLCTFTESAKQKLEICFALSEKFNSISESLNQFLDQIDSKPFKCEELSKIQSDLNKENSTSFAKLQKICNELKQTCQDTDCLDKEIENLKIKFENLNSKLEIEKKNQEKLENLKSNLEILLNSQNQENLQEMLKQNLQLYKELNNSTENSKFEEIKLLFEKLELKLNENSEIQNLEEELQKMEDKMKNIEKVLGIDELSLKLKQNNLTDIKGVLENLNNQLNLTQESLNNKLNNLDKENADSLLKIQEIVQNLNEKCAYLNSLQSKEEESVKKQSSLVKNLEDQIENCNNQILHCFQEMDKSLKPIKSSSIQNLIKEQETFEIKCLKAIKFDLNKINLEFKELSKQPALELTCLEVNLEKLNSTFAKLELKFQERGKKLELALFKSSKFEDKIKILNENLQFVELSLEDLDKIKFSFDNLTQIEQQINTSNELIKHLLLTSNEIDEFKEICERIIQNSDDPQECECIEKKWTI